MTGAVGGGDGFTPGPWEVGRHGLHDFEVQGDGVQVAVLRGSFSRPVRGTLEKRLEDVPVDEAWANAALISAAPDMLAACEAMAGWDAMEKNAPPYDSDGGAHFSTRIAACDRAFDLASAAIRKAHGITNDATPHASDVEPR